MRILLAAIAALALAPSTSAAQFVPASDAVILARVCFHESGWTSTDDCAGIKEVLVNGSERHGLSFRSYALAYSGRALRGETSRSWVAQLGPRGRRPSRWPVTWDSPTGPRPHPGWSVFRDRWMDLLGLAERLMDGTASGKCETSPHDWGGPMDDARAERIGLIRIDCGETLNRFYLRPSLVERAEPTR